MEEKEINLLEAELLESSELIKHFHELILKRQPIFRDRDEYLDSMAYQLHNIYCAYEQLFEIVANFFENQVIDGARYHADLLHRMKMEIKGVRPALLSPTTYEMLNELRGFRYFFRHAYVAGLDADRIEKLVKIVIQLKEPFRQDMEGFLARLRG